MSQKNYPAFEEWKFTQKRDFLLSFLKHLGVPSDTILVHGSFALELLGFPLAQNNCGSRDVDLVCLDNQVFQMFAMKFGIDPNNPTRVEIPLPGLTIEVFSYWAPAAGLAPRSSAELRQRSYSVFFSDNDKGGCIILVPNVVDIITYKDIRVSLETLTDQQREKHARDQMHLDLMRGPYRNLLVSYLNGARTSELVGRDTGELAMDILLFAESQRNVQET